MGEQRIYLDHAATTPVRRSVREVMERSSLECYGNPSSLHAEGRAARAALEGARETIRKALGASLFRLVFTGSGTEGNNAALLGILLSREGRPRGGHVVTTRVEHPAVLKGLSLLQRLGAETSEVEVDAEGRVDPSLLESTLREDTCLISVMAANNEVGTLQPIEEVGALARERGIPFHTDAIQLLGKGPIDLSSLPVDLLTLAAHKIYGPKGVGALLVREGIPFTGLLQGGSQEGGLRAGTEAVAQAVGFARAVELGEKERPDESARLSGLRRNLRRGIERAVPGVRINTPEKGSLPGILNVSFPGLNGESLMMTLDHLSVSVSTGSACNTGTRTPSHVLQAMGRSVEEVRGSIRFSLGRSTGEVEIETALERLERAVEKLRRLAPSR